MKIKHPVEFGVFTALLLVFNFAGINPANLALFPKALSGGEYWRFFTFPWAHISIYHLALDAAAFLFLCDMLRCSAPTRLLHLASCIVFSGVVPLLFDPRLSEIGLRGLSGVAHGLMMVAALEALSSTAKTERIFGTAVLVGIIAKCLIELATGNVVFANCHLGNVGIPVPTCHLGGAIGGALSYGMIILYGETKALIHFSVHHAQSTTVSKRREKSLGFRQ